MSLSRFRSHKKGKIDSWLLIAVIVLAVIGLIMISSSSVVLSFKNFDTNYYYVWRQALHFGIGLVGLIVFALIDYRIWQKLAPWLLIAMVGLLLATFIPGLGQEAKGATRWIALGPVQFQPSEFVKILAILYFSAFFASKKDVIGDFKKFFVPFILTLGVIALLILVQPDAGTALITVATIIVMYFAAGAPYVHLVYGAFLALISLVPLVVFEPYRLQRILVLLNPSSDTLGAAYHANQALLGVGAGGLWGLGYGGSKQKYLYLPEPHTDSIFAITIEELGFIRSTLVLLLIVFVIMKALSIARNAPDDFARFVAVGIGSLIAIQTFVNIGAMLGVLPLTGVTLPFISAGGSSLVAMMVGVGILLNISKATQHS